MIDALFTVAVYVALAFAVLGGAIVLTALAIWAWDRLTGDTPVGYDETVAFTDWQSWEPNPDDPNIVEFDWPERAA